MKRIFATVFIVILLFSMIFYSGIDRNVSAEPQSNATETIKVPAFPGAEGAGKWATGGRGGRVIEVTNLNDSGPGSLREAIEAKGQRIVVFKVSGTIELKNRLNINNPDITIAGQTAPGDGITLKGAALGVNADNVIIRYIRARLGDKNSESDAMGVSGNNIIIDHCTASWSVDETFSVGGNNITVQWCIISESLVNSIHKKGPHGFGGIWGGNNATYHHNLIAQHSSRNPRFGVGSSSNSTFLKVDFVNNVIYNWGYNSVYGADGDCSVNMVNNYYKPGPDTRENVKSRIFDTIKQTTKFYISGNYVEGNSEVTADNWKGVNKLESNKSKLSQPIHMPESVTTRSAEEAYKLVLENAGATLPRRDAADARVVSDVKNGTGRNIDSEDEVGGYPVLVSEEAPADSDHDGMPDEWEKANGLDPANSEDGSYVGNDGYTNVERYINSITASGSKNPEIKIKSPIMNSTHVSGKTIKIEAEASDTDGSIAKVEFYNGTEKIGEKTEKPYSLEWKNVAEGIHYISAVATDDSGTKTQSSVIRVFVNDNNSIKPWTSKDIGETKIPGSSSLNEDVLIVKGNGKIGDNSDIFHYTYQKLNGDGELSALLKLLKPNPYGVLSGIMIRESLCDDSPMVFIGLRYSGVRDNILVLGSRKEKGGSMETEEKKLTNLPTNIKLVRSGNKFTAYYSQSYEDWQEFSSVELVMNSEVYIGFACDSGQQSNKTYNYSRGQFSNINYSGNITAAANEGLNRISVVIIGAGALVLLAAVVIIAALKGRKKSHLNSQDS